jgi:serine/threonine protein kinase
MWSSLEGLVIGERYEIEEHVATGGMAAVFRGWDHRVERPVAIKVLRQLEHADEGSIARFRREAHAAAKLNHRNIVRAYDFFEDHGCYYLVMEYVDGINLKQCLRRQGPLPVPEALAIARQVCAALHVAHAQGFIHRDIKPQNILLDAAGLVKVTDFGIVHIAGGTTLTTDGLVLGTADYIAPEQARGDMLSPATDVYSLGVVLYEMLTGHLPFTGPTAVAVAAQHATAPALPISRVMPALSPYIGAVVMRALQKEPERRYTSAGTMALAIHMAQETLVACETAESAESADTWDVHMPLASAGDSCSPAPEQAPVAAAMAGPPAASEEPQVPVRASAGAAAPVAEQEVRGWQPLAGTLLKTPSHLAASTAQGGFALALSDAEADGHLEEMVRAFAWAGRSVPWLRIVVAILAAMALAAAIMFVELWLHAHGG